MRNILLFVIAAFLLFSSCAQDSALSDIEFDDPGVIRPVIELSKIMGGSGVATQHINAYLYDKNDDLIRLNNGRVLVNQKEMVLKKELFTDARYYSGTEAIGNIQYPEVYLFNVEFSNGDSYDLSITTQAGEFLSLNTPDKHSKENDLRISWNPLPDEVNIDLELMVSYVDDTVNTTKTYNITNLKNSNTGKYIISAHYFNENPETYSVKIKLLSTILGYVNRQFMAGGKITSVNSISKSVEIY